MSTIKFRKRCLLCCPFFPRDVLDEILNLIESVSEDFLSYSSEVYSTDTRAVNVWPLKFDYEH